MAIGDISTTAAAATNHVEAGLRIKRHFTMAGMDPFDEVQWELRRASIENDKWETIFEQSGVEVPAAWSATATNVVASKYFHGKSGSPERESSVRQLIRRVAETIRDWGVEGSYFHDPGEANVFRDELVHLLVCQKASFNSPVWFNCGLWQQYGRHAKGSGWYWDREAGTVRQETEAYRHPQCSACFINSVEDSMESILSLAKTEGMLFKWGSGTGTNLSPIRSSREALSGGGTASGPVSFMRGYDAFAGVIKSGGKTRRAAKMVILNMDHPDIVEFIESKTREEKKAHTLIAGGYDGSLDGEAYSSIFFQNANNSVRASDEFMQAVEADREWTTRMVTTGEPAKTYRARELLDQVAAAAWQCGDPGMQFDSTINRWNPCKTSGRINASNPCSEYMFLDDSACNLASLNLLSFWSAARGFDAGGFRQAVRVMILAQEILIDNASYPTARIAQNSHDFRPLGLGYANLGALLMANGLPYDSEAGRDYAAAITAIMHFEACLTSSRIASALGAFARYEENRESFLNVFSRHRVALRKKGPRTSERLFDEARGIWDECLPSAMQHGFRNAQVTVLAPTGTIAFMMDCATTGIEPDLALVKYKRLAGGGLIRMANDAVGTALGRLGYLESEQAEVLAHIEQTGTIEGASALKAEHLPVFDCSLKPARGMRSIGPFGHVRMMAAVQPFLSGAISKTVNLAERTDAREIAEIYVQAWKLGVKAIAVYRDGSKRAQPLTTAKSNGENGTGLAVTSDSGTASRPFRRHLPDERRSITHKFSVGGQEGYLTVGVYEDGQPGELFICMSKEGSTVSGLMDAFATSVSLALQYGVPLNVMCAKFSHMRFEPSGWTGHPAIGFAKSLMDYIFRYLELRFLKGEQGQLFVPVANAAAPAFNAGRDVGGIRDIPAEPGDGPPCQFCGSLMVRNGSSCFQCLTCGTTSGCG
jgi:ribonucleoside-diphosphate reductase alpha chain